MKAASVVQLLLLLFASASRSHSPFDGTWVIDTTKNENLANEKPKVFLVSDGVFRGATARSRLMARIKRSPLRDIGMRLAFA
jgi:hypothetical protein